MSVTARKDLAKETQKQLVGFSVRAQDFLIKQGLNKEDANRTMEEMFHNSLFGATTNASRDFDPSRYHSMNKSMHVQHDEGPGFALPAINKGTKGSPFRGFKDISIVTQKLRKEMHSQDGTALFNRDAFEFGSEQHQRRKDAYVPINDSANPNTTKATRFAAKDRQVQMSSKVLENWIDETLQDAEHLDIPGVILTPENKLPITRYGIDRPTLNKANIDSGDVDRIYRALFVYSVGFYELLKKIMAHTEKKYTVITNIWKVFAILLEYCCRTDYTLLIQAISKEHKEELERLEKEYQKKFNDQAQNELVRKENQDALQKYCEELDRERMNEKQLRLKLEEDYNQNTKNHEEEVQLRLKFESKLNNMHSAHRELESKYKRVLNDLHTEKKNSKLLEDKLQARQDEISSLKTQQAENESQMLQDRETIGSLNREMQIKSRQMRDMELRTNKAQDELDLFRYKVQESQKDNTELKLKIDVNASTISGLESEKSHLTLEVKELRELSSIYEEKTKQLMHDLQETQSQLQLNKREMIGFSEVNRNREEKISKLKSDLQSTKMNLEERELQLGTLSIKYKKTEDTLDQMRKEYDDVVDKLHKVTKARHDLETQLRDEIERNRSLQEVVNLKEETLEKRVQDIDELEKKMLELERTKEAIDIKRQGVERAFEMAKKQLNEKIQSLNEVISGEKETRDMWIERYEKESRERTATESQLLAARSDLKDQLLVVKNAEIKNSTLSRQIQLLTEQNKKFQHEVNEAIAKAEGLDRELATQKEILKQMELTKKEYIDKLKEELEVIEKRYVHLINANAMLGEDYRSQGLEAYYTNLKLREVIEELKLSIQKLQYTVNQKDKQLTSSNEIIENQEMNREEDLTRYGLLDDIRRDRENEIEQQNMMITRLNQTIAEKTAELEKIFETKRMRKDVNTMTIIGSNYFNKEKNSLGQTKGSGSITSPRLMTGQSQNSGRTGISNPMSRAKEAMRKPSAMDGQSNSSKMGGAPSQQKDGNAQQIQRSPTLQSSLTGQEKSSAKVVEPGQSHSKPSIDASDQSVNKPNEQLSVKTLDEGVRKANLGEINKDTEEASPTMRRAQQSLMDQINKPVQVHENIVSNSQSIETSSVEQVSPAVPKKNESIAAVDSQDNNSPENATIVEQTDEETVRNTSNITRQQDSQLTPQLIGYQQQRSPNLQHIIQRQGNLTQQTELMQSTDSEKTRQIDQSLQQPYMSDPQTEQQSLMPNMTMQADLQQIPGRRITVDISNPMQPSPQQQMVNQFQTQEQYALQLKHQREKELQDEQQRQQEIVQLQQQAQRQPKGPTNIRKLIMSANTRE